MAKRLYDETDFFNHETNSTTMTATFTYTLVLAAIYVGRKIYLLRTQAA